MFVSAKITHYTPSLAIISPWCFTLQAQVMGMYSNIWEPTYAAGR